MRRASRETASNGIDHMIRRYTEQTVFEALQDRLRFVFGEFDNVFVSFSGGKDSGLLLNLVLDFRNKHFPNKIVGVFHQDFEAQYSATTEYVERTFDRIEGETEPYWVCLPMATRTALSSYEMFWYPWDDEKEDAWVRPMPEHPYVVNLEKNPIETYRYRMHQEDLAKQFGRWYRMAHGGGKRSACSGSAPTNRCTATAEYSTSAMATKGNAGSLRNSRTFGPQAPFTIGRCPTSGTQTRSSGTTTTAFTTCTTWRASRPTRCGSPPPSGIRRRTASTSTA